jgi:murein L,D-transpeptidase YcbB/YkuD
LIIKYRITLALFIFLFLSACEQKKPPEPSKGINEKLKFSYSEFTNTFKKKFISDDWSSIFKDSLFQYYDTLKSFYLNKAYQPVFIKSFEEKEFIDSLLDILGRAGEHGLNPEQYHYSLIKNEFARSFDDSIANTKSYSHLTDTDLLISDAVLKYSYHLRYGLINPKKIFPDSYFLSVVDSSKRDLLEPFKQKNIIQYLSDIQPKNKRYKDLQTELKHFESSKDSEWSIIPLSNKKLEPGHKNSSMDPIIKRLITLGFLDTSKVHIKDFNVYDTLLVNSVKHFQRLNGLNDDGVIGKNTVDKLNTTPQEYINKLKINLERFRWNSYSDTSQYVLVNIPDFRLFIIDSEKTIYDTKVCTGRKRPANYKAQLKKYKKTRRLKDKPEDWETPVIQSTFSYLVLNPTWNVPESIIREEIFQKVSEDSSYLLSHNFKIYLDTTEIDPMEVKLSDLSSEDIQFKIVQDPGQGNALGKIKFIFNNQFGIYLHDTPTRAPFNYSNRAVSHGCVRVEKPMPLAEFLLKGHPKWNMDFLKIEIGQRVEDKSKISEYKKIRKTLRKNEKDDKTTEILLSKKVPLYIDYYTAWVDENGEINFRDDVYNKDKILMEYLVANHLL